MSRVIIESPLGSPDAKEFQRNLEYARAAMKDSFARNEVPFASHLLYTQVLDDKKPEDRELGICAGLHWYNGQYIYKCAVYTDRGITEGMQRGIVEAGLRNVIIEFRKLGPEWGLERDL